MPTELLVPSAGESITEVMIGDWLKPDGQFVETDEPVVEIETDKASMELPAPKAGILVHKKNAGDTAGVGELIGVIEESDAPPTAAAATPVAEPATQSLETNTADSTRVMPAAQRALDERGLTSTEVQASGPGGRLLKEDVLRHTPTPNVAPARTSASGVSGKTNGPSAKAAPTAAARSSEGDEEVVPMTMLRRRIAERLVEAQQQAALLTTFNEIDMTAVLALRKQRQDAFVKRYGIKLGFMSFFVKAAIDALKLIPAVNAEIRGTDVAYKNHFDIGVAVSTEAGLVVPVVRDADRKSFSQLEQEIADLAGRARKRKLNLEELQGGTFTISNGGIFGSLMSTPIVNPPQSGILGLHAIQERPVARDGQVEIRRMMYVALSYDHRIVDGRESVTFLKRIKECIEDPTRMLIEV